MDKDLRSAFDEIEAQRIRLLGSVRTLTPGQQEFRPSPGTWCVLEVVQHLVLSEEAFLAYARKKLEAPAEETTLAAKALLLGVNAFMRSPFRVKAPVPAVVPREIVPHVDLSRRWEAARDGLRDLLEGLPAERLGKVLFKHPVAGKITAHEGLEFFGAHVAHHLGQIERIKASTGYPRG